MRVKDFCNIRIGYAFRERLTNISDGNVMVVQPKNITQDGFVFEKDEPLRTNVPASKVLQAGDVLVVNRGRFAAEVFNLEGAWVVPSSILILSVNDESVLPEYVALYFNSVKGQNMFRRRLEQTTVPFISAKNLGAMDIPVPPLERQKDLIAFEKSVTRYNLLTNKKQELLQKILNTELNITNKEEIPS
ncbi:restriction endonuclease subunit S [Verrucomicrobiota bacterium]